MEWFVRLQGVDEYMIRQGKNESEVSYPDPHTGLPVIEAVPITRLPPEKFEICRRQLNGYVLAKIIVKP